jgi:GNAT superfamily N-acetyltransferase
MTAAPRIEHEPSPSEADMRWVGDGLTVYNEARAGPIDYQRMFLSARNEDGSLVGGLIGGTSAWGWLFVGVLFVDEAHRGTGVGGELLAQAEALAIARGATNAYLDTFSFQAEPFYAARGYTVFGALDDFPPGHRRMWMSKTLRATGTEP